MKGSSVFSSCPPRPWQSFEGPLLSTKSPSPQDLSKISNGWSKVYFGNFWHNQKIKRLMYISENKNLNCLNFICQKSSPVWAVWVPWAVDAAWMPGRQQQPGGPSGSYPRTGPRWHGQTGAGSAPPVSGWLPGNENTCGWAPGSPCWGPTRRSAERSSVDPWKKGVFTVKWIFQSSVAHNTF